ncbi:mechanosensitive ion channel family protein [Tropicimonas sp. IMCC6043]|uniref:mechanosensitive ion channel family protein n=1 Tax=Tropicimonas sp. IMCC6043 TaxID=2510645 RepID=UPI00101D23F4|nr:mechanosensitive ion channel family protein [Tropicimonas sp. IMCC6043]RYH09066.1 mechanosensitive ion channel family protein [Tropicimonas sp. IMCC6043]
MQSTAKSFSPGRAGLRLAALLLALTTVFAPPVTAQEEAPADQVVAETEGDAGPAFPAGLDDPGIDLEELELRLIPLTADELSALAKRWQEIVQEQTTEVIDATIAARSSDTGPTQEDTDSIVSLSELRGQGFNRFSAVVRNLEKKGGDEAEVAKYRAYRSAILLEEKQRADWSTLVRQTVNWARSSDGGIKVARNVGVVLLSLVALFLVARIVRGYARRALERVPDLSRLLQAFLAMVAYWITVAIGLMVVLAALGIDITPLFAVVGGASFILAFAMQDTLGNLAAGLMIMFNRPFDEGDYITAAGTAGTVKSVSIVSTTVTTPDNQVIVVPNAKVWGDVITNATASDRRRVDLVFGIDYADDPDKAIEIILEEARADGRVLDDPEPWVRVTNLGSSSVDLTARLWCNASDYWELKFALTRAVKLAFDRNGISIPYPHSVEIHKQA